MKRFWKPALSVIVAALAAAGSAGASAPVPDGPDSRSARAPDLAWREITYEHGKIVRVRVSSAQPGGREVKGRSVASTSDPFGGADPGFDVTDPFDGSAAEAGADYASCKSVDVSEPSYTLFHHTAYRFHHTIYFCYRYPRITVYHPGVYLSDVDSSYEWRGLVASHGYWYTWRGDPRGGHFSFRQGHLENCISPWGPCIRDEYPWVRIWVNGNGAWSFDTGGGGWIG